MIKLTVFKRIEGTAPIEEVQANMVKKIIIAGPRLKPFIFLTDSSILYFPEIPSYSSEPKLRWAKDLSSSFAKTGKTFKLDCEKFEKTTSDHSAHHQRGTIPKCLNELPIEGTKVLLHHYYWDRRLEKERGECIGFQSEYGTVFLFRQEIPNKEKHFYNKIREFLLRLRLEAEVNQFGKAKFT